MKSVVVVGAGAIGLASAYYLRKSGYEVSVIDPAPLAARASGHNAGWVIPSMSTPVPAPGMLGQALRWMMRSDSPLYVNPSLKPSFIGFMLRMLSNCTDAQFKKGTAALASLSVGALAQFDALAAEGVRFQTYDKPLTMLFADHHKAEARATELRLLEDQLQGFTWDYMSDDDLRGHTPTLSANVVAGITSQGDRFVDPASFVHGLAAACKDLGVELLLGSSARLEEHRSGKVGVRVNGKTLTPDRVVVAAGAWSRQVLSSIGEHIPVQAGKGYGYDLPVTPESPTTPHYLPDAKVAITPFPDRIRVAGTMGFGGANDTIIRRRAEGILQGASAHFQGWPDLVNAPAPWSGLRPMTPDGVPIIGPLSRHPSVLVATGHAMLGISLAPVTGQLIAELVNDAQNNSHIPGLAASRF